MTSLPDIRRSQYLTYSNMKYFTINELCKSKTAARKKIDNAPTEDVKKKLKLLIELILDPLREAYGAPIIVDSAYRCPKLNRAVGGSSTSQHKTGEAADIRTVKDTPEENKKLYDLIKKLNLPFDQLINEYGFNWVHVSYSPRNRRQELKIG